MLIELLSNDGTATTENISKALLARDQSQVDYYKDITKNMVGKVLTESRGITSKIEDIYILENFDDLSQGEVGELISLCEK